MTRRLSVLGSQLRRWASTEGLRSDLALAYRAAAHHGLNEGVCNHFTAAFGGGFLVIEHGTPWSKCSPDRLLEVDGDGRVVSGDAQRLETTAFNIHRAIHQALGPRAACVLHTHMPFATVLCSLLGEAGQLLMTHQNSARFIDRVVVDADYGGAAVESAEGQRMCAPLVQHPEARVLFLRNHGVVVVGPTVAQAFDDLYYLERAAMVQVLALQAVGGDCGRLALIPDATARKTRDQIEAELPLYAGRHWDSLVALGI